MMRAGWCGLTLFAAGCVGNPATGDRELALIAQTQEITMGRAGAQDVVAARGAHQNAPLQAYVNRIGQSVAESANRSGLTWEFTVVEDASVNAFALPGGFIFVTRGLLAQLGSEAELATVLGHEIAHVTARHTVMQLSRAQRAALGLGIGAEVSSLVARFAPPASEGVGYLFLRYGRSDESHADRLGFGYAMAQGWDARKMRGLFAMLQRDARLREVGTLPTWQTTHPDPGDRLRAVDRLVDASTADFSTLRVGIDAYFKEIDGLVYGEDPRAGYFEGTQFVHPSHELVLRFPDHWTLHNAPQVVTAVSPDGDAVLELRGALGSLEEAARAFVGQAGVTASPLEAMEVHGHDAFRATFVAQTAGEPAVWGMVTFVRFGGATWRIVGFASPARYPAVSTEFVNTAESFARLVDPAALAVQPRRLQIITVPRSMTLGEFDTQYPSGVSLEELAMLNRLGSKSTLAAGQLVKRIVDSRPQQTAQRR
jgi:predicted Zn-dependent protease